MIAKRCPSCRTLCDAQVDTRCFACGGDLAKAGPMAARRSPQLLNTSLKDKKTSSALLIVLAVLGGLGAISIVLNPGTELPLRLGLGAVVLVSIVLGILSLTGHGMEGVRKPILGLFAFFGVLVVGGVALLFALLLILFVACATGSLNFH